LLDTDPLHGARVHFEPHLVAADPALEQLSKAEVANIDDRHVRARGTDPRGFADPRDDESLAPMLGVQERIHDRQRQLVAHRCVSDGVAVHEQIGHRAALYKAPVHTLGSAMMEDLIKQIETRFEELQRELADPDVINDRERFTAASRAYAEL